MSKVVKNVEYNNNNKFDVDLQTGQLAEAELVEIIGGNKLEVKRDFRAHETGNIAVEIECYGKPSGLSVSEAEHYAFACDHITFIIETQRLKDIISNMKKPWTVFGGDNNRSKMVLLPMRELIKYSSKESS